MQVLSVVIYAEGYVEMSRGRMLDLITLNEANQLATVDSYELDILMLI